MNYLNRSIILLMFIPLAACNLQTPRANNQQITISVPTVEVTVEIVPPYPSQTPVVCTSLPQGMTFSANPVSPTAVRIEIIGLQAGESVTYIFRAQSDGHTLQMEGHPVLTADANGRYVEVVNGLSPEMKHWTIQVIHSHGVACTEVDMP